VFHHTVTRGNSALNEAILVYIVIDCLSNGRYRRFNNDLGAGLTNFSPALLHRGRPSLPLETCDTATADPAFDRIIQLACDTFGVSQCRMSFIADAQDPPHEQPRQQATTFVAIQWHQ
jgi:hypothetical protein